MKKLATLLLIPMLAGGISACNNGEPELGKAQSGVESASALATTETSSTSANTNSQATSSAVMKQTEPGAVTIEVDGSVIDEQFTPVVCMSDDVPTDGVMTLDGGVDSGATFHGEIANPDAEPTLRNLEIHTHSIGVYIDERFSSQAMVTQDNDAWIIEGPGVHEGHNDTELPATVRVQVVCPV